MSQLTSLIESLLELNNTEYSEAQTFIDKLIIEGKLHHSESWAAHMTPSLDPPALLGQLLSGLHNGNLLSPELYPQLVKIEKQLIDWLCPLFQHEYGHFTHGSTYANLEALWYARQHSPTDLTVVYGSQDAHYSIAKACHILGLQFKSIVTNDQGEMSIKALQQACQQHAPVAIVATAGTSSCGAIDSISSCIALAKQFSSWCHIDAAWGGALMLISKSHLLAGLKEADSVSFDPHKALGQPRPCGVLFYRQPVEPTSGIDYLMQAPKQSLLGSYGGELFLPLWFSLLLSGEKKLIQQLNHRLQQAEQFYCALKQQTDWWVLSSPAGIVCFRPPDHCDLSALIQQGIFSKTTINQQSVYRAVFASDKTEAKMLFTALEGYF
ncbi:MAG: aspartate aminotransferase family protein [Methylophaga sp.]|nr:MAG: aspartate aminotransferase family protein [Methylophaga sp.]